MDWDYPHERCHMITGFSFGWFFRKTPERHRKEQSPAWTDRGTFQKSLISLSRFKRGLEKFFARSVKDFKKMAEYFDRHGFCRLRQVRCPKNEGGNFAEKDIALCLFFVPSKGNPRFGPAFFILLPLIHEASILNLSSIPFLMI